MSSITSHIREALAGIRRLTKTPGRSLMLGSLLVASSAITVVATANTPPTVANLQLNPAVVNEGGTVTLTGGFTDPDAGDAHMVQINWRDGSATQKVQLPVGQLTFQATHKYTDDLSPIKVWVTVSDKQLPPGSNDNVEGLGWDSDGVTVEVKNVAPILGRIWVEKQSQGGIPPIAKKVIVKGAIVDPGADTHQVSATWGDSPLITNCTVVSRSFTCQHTYNTFPATNYTIQLHVVDDNGGQGGTNVSVHIP